MNGNGERMSSEDLAAYLDGDIPPQMTKYAAKKAKKHFGDYCNSLEWIFVSPNLN